MHLVKRSLPLLTFIVFIVLFFHKTVIWGLIPAPFDLLVAWFHPYTSGGWVGGGNFLAYKGGHFASDAFRQIYLWRELVISSLRIGDLPLWNPYAFSGTPLLANLQSAVFYPFNLIFLLVTDFSVAWTLYIVSAVLFGAIFMFMFLKLLKLGNTSAVVGAIAFAASGYVIVWLEWGIIVHELVWLPMSLFAVKRWWESGKIRFLLLLVASVSATIFAGYAQGAAYNLLILVTWIAFLTIGAPKNSRLKKAAPLLVAFLISLGVSAMQWIPTAELYFHSAMRGQVSQTLSKEAALPIAQVITLLAPDYFGNRVTDDYWGKDIGNADYMDADLFLGIGTVILAAGAIVSRRRRKEAAWFISLMILGFLLGTKTPITAFIADLNIPVVSTGGAAEAMLISLFALCCLAALFLEDIILGKPISLRPLMTIAVIMLMLFGVTFFLNPEKAEIARKSLRLPLTALVISGLVLVLYRQKKLSGRLVGAAFIIIIAVELLLHADKILPFSSADFAYPKHVLIEELKTKAGFNRVDGFWENEFVTNLPTAFRLYSAEGYDPLYIRRYGELVAAADRGSLQRLIPRSDADITMNNETNRNRLLDLTSIKYINAKVTDPSQTWEEEPMKYDPSRFTLVWQQGKFKIYENLQALPRVMLFEDWRVIRDDEQIIDRLYSIDFNPHQQLILEQDPGISVTESTNQSQASILRYLPNGVEVNTQNSNPSILLLTDSFYPGWKAEVDGEDVPILRANYAFRGVAVPAGAHQVLFTYRPESFLWGASISAVSLCVLLALGFIFGLKSRRRPDVLS